MSYRIEPAEPYEDYDLYKPYNGKLTITGDEAVNVWLERTTAEEQAAQRTVAEADRAQRQAQEEQAQKERDAELEARKLYYRIETNCANGVDITMSNVDGDTTQYSNRGNDWYYWMVPRSGQFLYLSAQNQCDYGYVTTKLVMNGQTIKENTSSGDYVIATVSGRW